MVEGDQNQSCTAFKQSAERAERANSIPGRARALYNLSVGQANLDRFEEAVENCTQAGNLFKATSNTILVCRCQVLLCDIFEMTGWREEQRAWVLDTLRMLADQGKPELMIQCLWSTHNSMLYESARDAAANPGWIGSVDEDLTMRIC